MLRLLSQPRSVSQPRVRAVPASASSLAASPFVRAEELAPVLPPARCAIAVNENIAKQFISYSATAARPSSSLVRPKLSCAPISPFSVVAEVAYSRTLSTASIFSRGISTQRENESIFDEVKISELIDDLNAQALIRDYHSDGAITNERLNVIIKCLPSIIALSLELYSLKNHYVSFNDKLSLKLETIMTSTLPENPYYTLNDLHPDSSSDYKNLMYCLLRCQSAITYYTRKAEESAGVNEDDMFDCLKEANSISFLINHEKSDANEVEFLAGSSHSDSSSIPFSNKQSSYFSLELGLGIVSLLATGYIIHTLLDKDNKAQPVNHVNVFDEDKINKLVDKLKDIDPYHLSHLDAEEINLAIRELPAIIRLLLELFGAKHFQIEFNPELSAKLQVYVDRSMRSSQKKMIDDVYAGASKDYRNIIYFLLTYQTELCNYSDLIGRIKGEKGWTYLDYVEKSKSITFIVKSQENNLSLSPEMETRWTSKMGSRR